MTDLTTFVAASGLTAAIALVWAQLWGRAPTTFWLRELWLMWCYAGVLLVLMALGWAGYGSLLKDCWESYEVPWQAIGLFMAGFVMTAVNVLQSLVGALCGFWRGDSFLRRRFLWKDERRRVTAYFASWALAIIGLSLWIADGHFGLSWWHSVGFGIVLLLILVYFCPSVRKYLWGP